MSDNEAKMRDGEGLWKYFSLNLISNTLYEITGRVIQFVTAACIVAGLVVYRSNSFNNIGSSKSSRSSSSSSNSIEEAAAAVEVVFY